METKQERWLSYVNTSCHGVALMEEGLPVVYPFYHQAQFKEIRHSDKMSSLPVLGIWVAHQFFHSFRNYLLSPNHVGSAA